jgi:hypothetical protein
MHARAMAAIIKNIAAPHFIAAVMCANFLYILTPIKIMMALTI